MGTASASDRERVESVKKDIFTQYFASSGKTLIVR